MPQWLIINSELEIPRRTAYRAEDVRRVVLIDHVDDNQWGVALKMVDMPNDYVWVVRFKPSEQLLPLLRQTFDTTLKAVRTVSPVAEIIVKRERAQGGHQLSVELAVVEDVKPEKKPAPKPQPKNQIRGSSEQGKEEEARKGRLRSSGLSPDSDDD